MIAIVYVALIVLGVIIGILALSILIAVILWVDTILKGRRGFCKKDVEDEEV